MNVCKRSAAGKNKAPATPAPSGRFYKNLCVFRGFIALHRKTAALAGDEAAVIHNGSYMATGLNVGEGGIPV